MFVGTRPQTEFFTVIAKDLAGEVALSGDVENWIGIPHTTGGALAQQFADHMQSYHPKLVEGVSVSKIEKTATGFTVTTDDQNGFSRRKDKTTGQII